ncbi:MAG TPA: Nudix family hydrolase [Burkholderiales bacterium]|nr:Nudix family hydrolase [Burkholderiales bacterium]
MTPRRVEVAAAVLQRADGSFLLAQRPAGKFYAGYWEFPGGKIEPGEAAVSALVRELHEELGIDVQRAYPWITRDYDYAHAAVRLRFYRVTEWSGELHGRESQQFMWQHVDAISVSPLLPANGPILGALALPSLYGISNAADVGSPKFLSGLQRALEGGLRLIQIRDKSLAPDARLALAVKAVALARAHRASIVINGDAALAARVGADGVHLTSTQLMAARSRPAARLVGASCHDERELARAAEIGADFVVLGPVTETATHAASPTLGWHRFGELIADYPLPVYAIGGLREQDFPEAWQAGAHGIAAIRGAWPPE